MPLYRYQCMECNAIFKEFKQNGNGAATVCPECGSTNTKRLLPRVGIIYKGNGYYNTDYAGKVKKAKEVSSTKDEE
ncbi:MAG: FmdB family zinc ribbon protein [Candidatus Bipolaricaulota bacterium]|nr:FmdB family zinc ribbon protein [Candidatus Bipolaricaulota bacterium]